MFYTPIGNQMVQAKESIVPDSRCMKFPHFMAKISQFMAQTVSVVICKLSSKTCLSFLVNEVLLGFTLGFNVNEIVEKTKTEPRNIIFGEILRV